MQIQTLLPAPALVQLDYLVASDVSITLVARTRLPEATCPSCGQPATRVQLLLSTNYGEGGIRTRGRV